MNRRYVAAILAAALILSLFALRPILFNHKPPVSSGDDGGSISGGNPPPPPPPPPGGKTLPEGFLGGVIEGYYGPPWSAVDTTAMIKFIGNQGMNTFVYAPKDDPFQRTQWRDLYPADQLQQLESLVSACKQSGVTFVYSLSPGLSIKYSSAADGKALAAKFDQLRSIGIDAFLLSFDDITGKLSTADAAAFNNDLGLAQSKVANALIAHEAAADANFQLVFAPTTYSGTKDNPYWQSLKANLDQRATVIWTGPKVLSPTITSDQVRTVEGYIGHKLVIWDNYPCNDYTYAQSHRPKLFLGPVTGRDAGVPALVAGYWFNPMQQAYASQLALATGAQYLTDPSGYNSSTAWNKAIDQLGGPAAAELKLLAANASSYYYNNPAPTKLAADLANVWQQPGSADLTKTSAWSDFEAFQQLVDELKALPDQGLYNDLKPWLDTLAQQGRVGQLALQVLQEKHQKVDSTHDSDALSAALSDLKANQYSIAGDAITAFAEKVIAQ